jgi:steroid delta-isomerase-like uncharacterized protein
MTAETDRNKHMVETYVREVINRGTNEEGTGRHPDSVEGMLELFSKYVAADAYDYAAPEMIGPQGAVDTLKVMWAAFPNSYFALDQLPAENDLILIQAVITGTNTGPLFGFPATGKDLRVHALQLFRCVDGKLAQHWGGISMISLMQQLGVYDQILAPKIAEIYSAMVHRYIDGVNDDDEAALREVFAVDFNDHNSAQVSGLPPGVEGVVTAHHMLNQSFSELTFTIDEIMVEGDQVAIRVHANGKHTGDFYGFPPTGKDVSWTAHRILRVKDGMFVEAWNEFDQVGILQQMGVVPSFAPPPNLEANKALVRRLYEEENKHNVDIVDELMSPDFVMHGDALNPYQKGLEPIKQGARMTQEAFPDLVVEIEDMVAAGDKVMVRLRWTGTHTGPFMGMPPTNKKMTWTAIATNRIENGKIVERWFNSDVFGLLQQFGIIPGG